MSKLPVELLDGLITELEISLSSLPKAPEKTDTAKSGIVDVQSGKSEKKAKSTGKAASAPAKAESAPAAAEEINLNMLDLRVGIITKVDKHATAEKLYCEEIDVGEEAPRAIASGLVPYYTLEQMLNRRLIVVCNLKPRNLVGFKSHGMVLCASTTNADGSSTVEFIDPPASSKPGDRIVAEGLIGDPVTPSKCDKMKLFEILAPDLAVDNDGIAQWKGIRLVSITGGETCVAPTIRNALIK